MSDYCIIAVKVSVLTDIDCNTPLPLLLISSLPELNSGHNIFSLKENKPYSSLLPAPVSITLQMEYRKPIVIMWLQVKYLIPKQKDKKI